MALRTGLPRPHRLRPAPPLAVAPLRLTVLLRRLAVDAPGLAVVLRPRRARERVRPVRRPVAPPCAASPRRPASVARPAGVRSGRGRAGPRAAAERSVSQAPFNAAHVPAGGSADGPDAAGARPSPGPARPSARGRRGRPRARVRRRRRGGRAAGAARRGRGRAGRARGRARARARRRRRRHGPRSATAGARARGGGTRPGVDPALALGPGPSALSPPLPRPRQDRRVGGASAERGTADVQTPSSRPRRRVVPVAVVGGAASGPSRRASPGYRRRPVGSEVSDPCRALPARPATPAPLPDPRLSSL